jgi:hypothetical protein
MPIRRIDPSIRNRFRLFLVTVVAAFFAGGAVCFAQDSDFNLDLHANSHATAEKIGLPVYPGAKIHNDKDDSSADLRLAFGDFHFSLLAVKYETVDSAARVLDFYRKPLSHYGRCWSACMASQWGSGPRPPAG